MTDRRARGRHANFVARALVTFVYIGLLTGSALAAGLEDVEEVAELQALFNKDAGSVRVMLLMSPT